MKTQILTLLFLCSFLVCGAQVDINKATTEETKIASETTLNSQPDKSTVSSYLTDKWSKIKAGLHKGTETVTGKSSSLSSVFSKVKKKG
jgi:hypothetical protein